MWQSGINDLIKEVESDDFKGIIKNKFDGKLYAIIVGIKKDSINKSGITSELYNLIEKGDSIIKKKNSNKCIIIKKDKEVV